LSLVCAPLVSTIRPIQRWRSFCLLADADSDLSLALQTLRAVCADGDATPSARSAASRTLLEFYGYLGTGRSLVPDVSRKAHSELTLAELQRRASELRQRAPSTPFDC
jgi:hypothetical protein